MATAQSNAVNNGTGVPIDDTCNDDCHGKLRLRCVDRNSIAKTESVVNVFCVADKEKPARGGRGECVSTSPGLHDQKLVEGYR